MMLLTRRQAPAPGTSNPALAQMPNEPDTENKHSKTYTSLKSILITLAALCVIVALFMLGKQSDANLAQSNDSVSGSLRASAMREATVQDVLIPAESKTPAPTEFPRFRCLTTKGEFEVELYPKLAPIGVKRIIALVESGLFNETIPFFRVNENIAQFGVYKRGIRNKKYDNLIKTLRGQDPHPYGGEGSDLESVKKRKARVWEEGTWASIGGAHMLVVLKPNRQMGASRHDAPAGKVVKGFDTVFKRLYNQYNDIINHPNRGPGPSQVGVMQDGMDYIRKEFPLVDSIKWCVMI